MDVDIIIFAVIWILVIGYSVVKSKIQKENKKPEPNETKLKRENQLKAIFEQLEAQDTKSTGPVKLKKTEPKTKQPVVKPVAQKAATMTPVSYSIAEEGQRVTTSKKKAEPTTAERTGLHNKENLKRAIIFGEVLQPKF